MTELNSSDAFINTSGNDLAGCPPPSYTCVYSGETSGDSDASELGDLCMPQQDGLTSIGFDSETGRYTFETRDYIRFGPGIYSFEIRVDADLVVPVAHFSIEIN